MKKIIFNNTPNKCIVVENQEYWISRSVAVVGILIFRNVDTNLDYVLIEKRSEKMDKPNQWCVPCGYIDFSETGWECLTREIFEETGLYLPDYEKNIVFDNDKQPFYTNTNPSENRQNIALRFGIVLDFKLADFPFNVINHKNDEVSDIQFVLLNDIANYDMAFEHDKIIRIFVEKYLKNIEKK